METNCKYYYKQMCDFFVKESQLAYLNFI